MARKNLWTKEQLETMAKEIKDKKVTDPGFNAKIYAEEKNIVYGTLYQALRRNGLFEPSRKRVSKKVIQESLAKVAETAEIPETPINTSTPSEG